MILTKHIKQAQLEIKHTDNPDEIASAFYEPESSELAFCFHLSARQLSSIFEALEDLKEELLKPKPEIKGERPNIGNLRLFSKVHADSLGEMRAQYQPVDEQETLLGRQLLGNFAQSIEGCFRGDYGLQYHSVQAQGWHDHVGQSNTALLNASFAIVKDARTTRFPGLPIRRSFPPNTVMFFSSQMRHRQPRGRHRPILLANQYPFHLSK